MQITHFNRDKNIFTYCFQPIQRLQSNFKIDGIRYFMFTEHNRDNSKLKIFSFIPQRQRIQPNFMNYTYQTTKQTQPEQPKNKDINVGFTTNTKFMLLQLRQRKFCYSWGNANSGVFIFRSSHPEVFLGKGVLKICSKFTG